MDKYGKIRALYSSDTIVFGLVSVLNKAPILPYMAPWDLPQSLMSENMYTVSP